MLPPPPFKFFGGGGGAAPGPALPTPMSIVLQMRSEPRQKKL